MKYRIVCNKCQRSFSIELQTTGKVRCRCPYCSNVLTCQIGNATQHNLQTTPDSSSHSDQPKNRLSNAMGKTSTAISKTSAAIKTFQRERSNGDLIVFFGFSILFILLVIAGLFVCAEITKAVLAGKSWILNTYIELLRNF